MNKRPTVRQIAAAVAVFPAVVFVIGYLGVSVDAWARTTSFGRVVIYDWGVDGETMRLSLFRPLGILAGTVATTVWAFTPTERRPRVDLAELLFYAGTALTTWALWGPCWFNADCE